MSHPSGEWYPWYPHKFRYATKGNGWTWMRRAFYRLFLDEMYISGGEFGPGMLSSWARSEEMELRTAKRHVQWLIDSGKICIQDGRYVNDRMASTLRSRDDHGKTTGRPREDHQRTKQRQKFPRGRKENQTLSLARVRGQDNRGEERKDSPPLSPSRSKFDWKTDEVFQRFWQAYPRQRRGNGAKAWRAWRRAIEERRATPEEIQAGVLAYAASDEVADKRAKGCEAWLNDDRWSCDYSARPVNDAPRPAWQPPGHSPDVEAAIEADRKVAERENRTNGSLPLLGHEDALF